MPVTLSINTGDGKNTLKIQAALTLPDSGTSLSLAGTIQQPGQNPVALTGSPLTMPAAPGSGSIFWNVQVNYLTGAAVVVQSTVADPPPAGQGPNMPLLVGQLLQAANTPPGGRATQASDQSTNVVIFRQTLVNGSPAAAWANTTNSVPDSF
jgi:hypothetical protein